MTKGKTEDKMLVLNMANLGSITGTAYGPLGVIPEPRVGSRPQAQLGVASPRQKNGKNLKKYNNNNNQGSES